MSQQRYAPLIKDAASEMGWTALMSGVSLPQRKFVAVSKLV
jgi:hypothetical protein